MSKLFIYPVLNKLEIGDCWVSTRNDDCPEHLNEWSNRALDLADSAYGLYLGFYPLGAPDFAQKTLSLPWYRRSLDDVGVIRDPDPSEALQVLRRLQAVRTPMEALRSDSALPMSATLELRVKYLAMEVILDIDAFHDGLSSGRLDQTPDSLFRAYRAMFDALRVAQSIIGFDSAAPELGDVSKCANPQ
jgi:hypothetical protein